MTKLLLVGAGGFIGAILRFVLSTRVHMGVGGAFPLGTLCVNVIGCLLIGVASGLLSSRGSPGSIYLLLVTGILGGFTTFSAFGLETLTLLNSNRPVLAMAYVSASLFLGVAAVALGRMPFV